MIVRKTVLSLGLSQLISWGISYYLIGCFGERIAADLGWTRGVVYGGFSLALLVMGVASPVAGRLIDRYGGRRVMVAGSLLNAAGCTGLALLTVPLHLAIPNGRHGDIIPAGTAAGSSSRCSAKERAA